MRIEEDFVDMFVVFFPKKMKTVNKSYKISPSKIVNTARTAYRVGKKIQGAYRQWSQMTEKRRKAKNAKFNTLSTGYDAGRFKKTKAIVKSEKTKALSSGYHMTRETYGGVTDAHTVYLIHSTYDMPLVVDTLVHAWVRKALRKAGISVNDKVDEIPFYQWNNSDGFVIEFVGANVINNGAQTLIERVTVTDNLGLDGIVALCTVFKTAVIDYLRSSSDIVPIKILVYAIDKDGATLLQRLASNLELTAEICTMFMSSDMKVQNRTAGDAAGATDKSIERVDNQPLDGRIFAFRNADPRLRSLTAAKNTITNAPRQAVRLVKATNLPVGFESIPQASIWGNCNGTVGVKLDPGFIKNTTIYYSMTGKYLSFMNKLRVNGENTGGGQLMGVAGRCQVIALEERIRTDSTNVVTVQYENRYEIGFYMKTTKPAPFVTSLSTTLLNNTA